MKEASSHSINFRAELSAIKGATLLRLSDEASKELPSRGQVSVKGILNGHDFYTVIEPDGYWGHWMRVDKKLQDVLGVSVGDTVDVVLEPIKEWPEPNVPQDLKDALSSAPENIQNLWTHITPMARWEWVRWINETRNPDTRQRRVKVSISKMQSGKRRPCCFNLAACTDPDLSKSGRLIS